MTNRRDRMATLERLRQIGVASAMINATIVALSECRSIVDPATYRALVLERDRLTAEYAKLEDLHTSDGV